MLKEYFSDEIGKLDYELKMNRHDWKLPPTPREYELSMGSRTRKDGSNSSQSARDKRDNSNASNTKVGGSSRNLGLTRMFTPADQERVSLDVNDIPDDEHNNNSNNPSSKSRAKHSSNTSWVLSPRARVGGQHKFIPESIIAQQLRINLSNVFEERKNGIHNITINILNHDYGALKAIEQKNTAEICDTIINAYESLYNKYIDADSAIYMINISSKVRKKLTHLFDPQYYISEQKKLIQKNSSKFRFGSKRSSKIISSNNSRTSKINSSKSRRSGIFSLYSGFSPSLGPRSSYRLNKLNKSNSKHRSKNLLLNTSRVSVDTSIAAKISGSVQSVSVSVFGSKKPKILINPGETFLRRELRLAMKPSPQSLLPIAPIPTIREYANQNVDGDENRGDDDDKKVLDQGTPRENAKKKQKDKEKDQQSKAVEWLLRRIFVDMNKAFEQIARLMNDSYSRFKINDAKLYQELINCT